MAAVKQDVDLMRMQRKPDPTNEEKFFIEKLKVRRDAQEVEGLRQAKIKIRQLERAAMRSEREKNRAERSDGEFRIRDTSLAGRVQQVAHDLASLIRPSRGKDRRRRLRPAEQSRLGKIGARIYINLLLWGLTPDQIRERLRELGVPLSEPRRREDTSSVSLANSSGGHVEPTTQRKFHREQIASAATAAIATAKAGAYKCAQQATHQVHGLFPPPSESGRGTAPTEASASHTIIETMSRSAKAFGAHSISVARAGLNAATQRVFGVHDVERDAPEESSGPAEQPLDEGLTSKTIRTFSDRTHLSCAAVQSRVRLIIRHFQGCASKARTFPSDSRTAEPTPQFPKQNLGEIAGKCRDQGLRLARRIRASSLSAIQSASQGGTRQCPDESESESRSEDPPSPEMASG